MENKKNKNCVVIEEYISPFPNPIKTSKGERLEILPRQSEWPGWIWCVKKDGQSGWIPDNYVEKRPDGGVMLRDYDATELTVKIGDKLKIFFEESDWAYCETKAGKIGWVPLKYVRKSE